MQWPKWMLHWYRHIAIVLGLIDNWKTRYPGQYLMLSWYQVSPSTTVSRRPSRRPSIVALPTGRWSRRSSLAGNEFLKMEDEVRFLHFCSTHFVWDSYQVRECSYIMWPFFGGLRIQHSTPPISQELAQCVPWFCPCDARDGNCHAGFSANDWQWLFQISRSRNLWASPYQFSDAFQKHSFPMINLTFKGNRVINGYAANYVSKNMMPLISIFTAFSFSICSKNVSNILTHNQMSNTKL